MITEQKEKYAEITKKYEESNNMNKTFKNRINKENSCLQEKLDKMSEDYQLLENRLSTLIHKNEQLQYQISNPEVEKEKFENVVKQNLELKKERNNLKKRCAELEIHNQPNKTRNRNRRTETNF